MAIFHLSHLFKFGGKTEEVVFGVELMRRGKSEGVGEVINEFGEGLVKRRRGETQLQVSWRMG